MRGLLLTWLVLALAAGARAQDSAATFSMQQENGIRVWGGCAANVSVARTFVLTARPGKQLTCNGLQSGCDTLPETANEVYRGRAWRQAGTTEADWSCWPTGTPPQGAFAAAGDCVVCQRCGPWCTNSPEPELNVPYPVCTPGYVPPEQVVPRMNFDDSLRPLFGVNPANATLTGAAFTRYGSSECFDAAAGTPAEERNRLLFRRLYAGQVYHLVQSGGGGLEHLPEGTALAERCWPESPSLPAELVGIAHFEPVGPCAVCTAYYPNDPAVPAS